VQAGRSARCGRRRPHERPRARRRERSDAGCGSPGPVAGARRRPAQVRGIERNDAKARNPGGLAPAPLGWDSIVRTERARPALASLLVRERSHPRHQGAGGDGAAEVVALREVAAHLHELVPGRPILHALGHHAQAQVVPQVDDRARDRDVVGVGGQVAHERFVDLDLIGR